MKLKLNYNCCIGKTPSRLDVLAGRGGKSGNHQANKDYLARADSVALEYATAPSRAKKHDIVDGIIEYVHQTGGQFVGQSRKDGLFYLLDPNARQEKVKQRLRDTSSQLKKVLQSFIAEDHETGSKKGSSSRSDNAYETDEEVACRCSDSMKESNFVQADATDWEPLPHDSFSARKTRRDKAYDASASITSDDATKNRLSIIPVDRSFSIGYDGGKAATSQCCSRDDSAVGIPLAPPSPQTVVITVQEDSTASTTPVQQENGFLPASIGCDHQEAGKKLDLAVDDSNDLESVSLVVFGKRVPAIGMQVESSFDMDLDSIVALDDRLEDDDCSFSLDDEYPEEEIIMIGCDTVDFHLEWE